MKQLAIKIDVDTERGTRIGVPNLAKLLEEFDVNATFLFALGPDNTGRAIRRIFRPGFFQKVQRTSVVSVYGIKTLGNGVLWPAPHIGKKHGSIMRDIYQRGFEVGIHCYDHIYWQDKLHNMTEAQVRAEVYKAGTIFRNIFGFAAKTIGAAGWQANKYSLASYDDSNLTYASDTRGKIPFFPMVGKKEFNTLQIPTTLPTLDELLGRPEYPLEKITPFFLSQICEDELNVLTIHAELEGIKFLNWFWEFLKACLEQKIDIVPMRTVALNLLKQKHLIPYLNLINDTIPGRSGEVATHSDKIS